MIVDVIDLDIDNLNFSKKYDSIRNSKAKTLYRYENVKINEVEKITDGTYKVKAHVNGTHSYYGVVLDIKGNMVKDYKCSCPDYCNGYICKHILATCMEVIEPHYASTTEGRKRKQDEDKKRREEELRLWRIQQEEQRKRIEYERKYNKALNLINKYKKKNDASKRLNYENNITSIKDLYRQTKQKQLLNQTNTPELSKNIKIEPQIELNSENGINVTFKIGEKQKYVIKDIMEFYDAFQKKETLEYGKRLKFIAQKESFDKEDLKLLEYILQYGEILHYSEELFKQSYYYYGSRFSTKYIKVNENKIDEFFELIKNKPIQISKYTTKEVFEFTDSILDIKINLEENDKDYNLKINIQGFDFLLSDKNIYIFYSGKIYKIERVKNKELINSLMLFFNNNEILIPKEKLKDFSTYIFPELGKYLISQSLPEEVVKEAVLVQKLASKMFLDLDDNGNIIMELKFCYNDKEFNILDSNYQIYVKENNIERNMIEERNVLTRIFQDGFELINGKNYFILKDSDATYEFLSEKVTKYMNDFEILVTDKFKNKEIRKPKLSSVSIKLDNGLLELDISKLDFDIEEIKNVLKNYSIKKKYYKLKNGDFLSLEQSEDLEFLDDMSNSFDINYEKVDKGIIKLPVNRSIYLDQLLSKNKAINTTKNDNFNSLINNIENKNFSENIKINKNFEKILRDYQKTGYKWLKVLEQYKLGGILADDMGLRKNTSSYSSSCR